MNPAMSPDALYACATASARRDSGPEYQVAAAQRGGSTRKAVALVAFDVTRDTSTHVEPQRHHLQRSGSRPLGVGRTSTGVLRVTTGGCRSSEKALSWNQSGPEGPQGAQGPQGEPGMLSTVGVGVDQQTVMLAHNETGRVNATCSPGDQAISGGFSFDAGGFRAHVLSSKRVVDTFDGSQGWQVSYRLEDPANANVANPVYHAVTLSVEVYCAVG